MSEDTREMQIYTAIENLWDYIEECKFVGFSGGNAKRVEIDEINALISDIKIHIPEEMRRAQAIISEADDILDSAQERADELTKQANMSANGIRERAKRHAEEIIREAELERDRLLDEHEITIKAKQEADDMIEATKKACQDTYDHAQLETSELLDEAERCLHNCVKSIHSERDRVGVRKMQTRYESAQQHEEELEEEPVTYVAEEAEIADFEEEEQEERPRQRYDSSSPLPKSRKKSGIKISEFAKKYLYNDNEDDSMFSDDTDSFDSDDEVDA